ncbi:alpha-E domain-containing protein [Erythrobacter sp. SCSIO 43205]|uniref:alpha-E domain-containing protein n=1 Tax=Erythrobacter sp. SCSIO 43205 TaxID=2779361 RepID=UPI001CA89388|nr:alpha-E domain-containing protein [Erythrobacter sp. SCSIO 43205]UAB77605.1 alpha-E domain-containing protein [Erythrobacter sp. SCSIO 43205]
MLGRTANGLFWMFRYLERAENTARLLEAGLRMALTRDVETARDEWRSVISTLGLKDAFEAEHDDYEGASVWNFVLRSPANPANVREMMRAVRNNARTARTCLSSEVWEAVNENWIWLDKQLSRPVSPTALGGLLERLRRTGTHVHGAMDCTILRDEGRHFGRAGTYIERAESTARILDMKYYLLLPSLSYVGSSLDTGQWEQVLRSVAGVSSFSWINRGNIDARSIVEFLVLDNRFPRSLAFCRNAVRIHLQKLAEIHDREGKCSALLAAKESDISGLSVDAIFEQGLHEFLMEFQAHNAAISEAIIEDYRFLS